jgi:hypothetical protein
MTAYLGDSHEEISMVQRRDDCDAGRWVRLGYSIGGMIRAASSFLRRF